MKFNEKLVKLRKSEGYTQEALAEKLGVSRQAVARWEAGDTAPDMGSLVGICQVFGVSADYMIHDDYESSEDIPVVKEKNEEIKTVNEKGRQMRLLSGFISAFAALCSAMVIMSTGNLLVIVLSSFSCSVFWGLAVFQFYNYSKKK